MRADWENIRNEEFPAANKNVQLKSGGGSPISKSAYEAAKKYFDDMLHYGDIFWIENLEKVERIRIKSRKISQFQERRSRISHQLLIMYEGSSPLFRSWRSSLSRTRVPNINT